MLLNQSYSYKFEHLQLSLENLQDDEVLDQSFQSLMVQYLLERMFHFPWERQSVQQFEYRRLTTTPPERKHQSPKDEQRCQVIVWFPIRQSIPRRQPF